MSKKQKPMSTQKQLAKDQDSNMDWIQNHVGLIVTIVLLIITVTLGVYFYRSHLEEKRLEVANNIYVFEQEKLQNFEAKKTSADAFHQELMSFLETQEKHEGYVSLLLKVIKLYDAQDVDKTKVMALSQKAYDYSQDNPYLKSLAGLLLASQYEDQANYQNAYETLQKVEAQKVLSQQAKVIFDLGRLALKTERKDDARTYFQRVINDFKDKTEYVKLSEYYLGKISN